jgi:homoaconitase/3-isopropylmalate dehydratase large subunit
MSAEMGAQTGLIAADDTTLQYLRGVGVSDAYLLNAEQWCSDDDAELEEYRFDGFRFDGVTSMMEATTLVLVATSVGHVSVTLAVSAMAR